MSQVETAAVGPNGIKFGARFPDIPIEPGVVKTFAQSVEDLGFDHITHFDHIAGMSDKTRPYWRAPYDYTVPWGETLTMVSFMAAATTTLEFMTTVLVLPLRQTALVAKQVGTMDALYNGRIRLGVGKGWNDIEYELMKTDFEDRDSVMYEQIELLRMFWTQEVVSYRGKHHRARAVGMNPLPERPIPIWMAPSMRPTHKTLAKVAKVADGILPLWKPDEESAHFLELFREELTAVGRDPLSVGIEAKIDLGISESATSEHFGAQTLEPKSDEDLAEEIGAWRDLGATHIDFKTLECGLKNVDEHLATMERFIRVAQAVGA